MAASGAAARWRMLLQHLSQHHRDQVGPYLERMRTECIATVAAEVYEVVEEA